MHHSILTICLLGILIYSVGNITAQDNIIINDSLKIHAEALEVDVDYPVSTNIKFRMGGYTIFVDNELRSTDSHLNESWAGVRVNKITKTFSFTIRDSSSNKVVVTTKEKNTVNTYYPNEVLENKIFINEFTGKKFESVRAWITFSGDDRETWVLFVRKGKEQEWTPPVEMILACGEKRINLINVSSDAHFNYSHPLRSLDKMPSMGVEFYQNGKSVCALQYDSGAANNLSFGPRQSFGCKAWMLYDLDPKTKLMLAATMSTLILLNNPYLSTIE